MKKKTEEAFKNLDRSLSDMALRLALNCVRNSVIEDYHSGFSPSSKTGDYTDVKVVTPYGEIPWSKVSRLSDDEMMEFNKEVVNRIYTFLTLVMDPRYRDDQVFLFSGPFPILPLPTEWDKPEIHQDFINGLKIAKFGPGNLEWNTTRKTPK